MKEITLQKIIDHFDKHNWELYIYEPNSNEEKLTLASNWNDIPQQLYDYLENFYNLDWSDECTGCVDCGAHIHTTPTSYSDVGDYIVTEYGCVCVQGVCVTY